MQINPQKFIACTHSFDEAELVIYGAPFDGTTSFRPGTRFAAGVLRLDSQAIETYSPYQKRDITELKICDAGDVIPPIGNPAEMLDLLTVQTDDIVKAGKMPVMVGGEHTLTQGVVKSLIKHYPDMHIFHFDAHTDLREEFFGQELSHANVIRKCWHMLGDGRIHSFGIRSGGGDEFDFGDEHLDFHRFEVDAVPESVRSVLAARPETPVYVTIDVDVLDPSVMPGTGTPEPGGVSFKELLNALLALRPLNIIGFDVVELSPPYDASGISNAAAWKIIREMFLIATARKAEGSVHGVKSR